MKLSEFRWSKSNYPNTKMLNDISFINKKTSTERSRIDLNVLY